MDCFVRDSSCQSSVGYLCFNLFWFMCFSPKLTWRDVQHLIAKTAKIPDPKEPGWTINAAGYHVHHRYGEMLMCYFTSPSGFQVNSISASSLNFCEGEISLKCLFSYFLLF